MDKRKVGRPRVTKEVHTKAVTITLTPAALELIDGAAENVDLSRSKMIEKLCLEGIARGSKED